MPYPIQVHTYPMAKVGINEQNTKYFHCFFTMNSQKSDKSAATAGQAIGNYFL